MEKINVEDMEIDGLYCIVDKVKRKGRKWIIKINEFTNEINITWWFLEGYDFNFKVNGIGTDYIDKSYLITNFDIFKLDKKEILKFTKQQILYNLE